MLVKQEMDYRIRTSVMVEKAIFSSEELGRLQDDGIWELVPHDALPYSLLNTSHNHLLLVILNEFIVQPKQVGEVPWFAL